MLKLLTCAPLPAEETEFFELVHMYFPCIYDIKYLMKSCKNLKGGLNDLAEDLEIERIGPQHQAGSDSLLTSATFFKMKKQFFENQIDDSKYMGILYGLTSSYANPGTAPVGSSSSSSSSTTSTSSSSSLSLNPSSSSSSTPLLQIHANNYIPNGISINGPNIINNTNHITNNNNDSNKHASHSHDHSYTNTSHNINPGFPL